MKKCTKAHRSEMCTMAMEYIDARLEKMHSLHANFGTGGKLDVVTKSQLKSEMSKLNKEIREFAPEFYKSIAND